MGGPIQARLGELRGREGRSQQEARSAPAEPLAEAARLGAPPAVKRAVGRLVREESGQARGGPAAPPIPEEPPAVVLRRRGACPALVAIRAAVGRCSAARRK